MDQVVGFSFLLAGVIGILLLYNKKQKFSLWGLWIGYLIFAAVYSIATYSHPYYHTQLIPIVALSLAAPAGILLTHLKKTTSHPLKKTIVLTVLVIPILLSVRGAVWKQDNPQFRRKAEVAAEIGELVHHGTANILLSEWYGAWLRYHGELFGRHWPTHWDFRTFEIRGEKIAPPDELLKAIKNSDKTKFFIITFMEEFRRQNDLRRLLYNKFPIFKETKEYIIFDLR